jgi:O-antigen ligase
MSGAGLKTLMILMGGVFLLALLLLARPGYLADPEMLSAIIFAQMLVIAVCKYKRFFFLTVTAAFLWAGIDLPFRFALLQGRWLVLGVGAVTGVAIYIKDRDHHFGTFHLVAFFCVLSAMVSALVSGYPEEAILKASSLLLLFLYGASGARIAVPVVSPEKFFYGLLRGCEVLTYFSAIAYFLFRWEFYGNPNSLGAVMAVCIIPVLLWGFLTTPSLVARRRLVLELALATLLLMSSFSRAGIAAAIISSLLVCASLRQYRLIAKGAAAAMVLAVMVVMFVPLPEEAPSMSGSESIPSIFLYKGKPEQGLMGSRRGPWDQTWAVIRDHPWFGSGFGTSLTGDDWSQLVPARSHFDSRVNREHGNSYLAIAEWVGLLGVLPFYFLIIVIVMNIGRVFSWLRRTQGAFSPAVPAAAILTAGLIHAAFEDWLFAVGYYLCVFFWPIAFILVDMVHAPAVVPSSEITKMVQEPQFASAASA